MRSLRHAHLAVIADSEDALLLAARLAEQAAIAVTAVVNIDAAEQLCRTGQVAACLVAYHEPMPDALSAPQPAAPGQGCGVVSLLIVPALTAYFRTYARRAGYRAAVPMGIAPRLLYRRIGAMLQRGRAADRRRRRLPASLTPLPARRPAIGRPTLH